MKIYYYAGYKVYKILIVEDDISIHNIIEELLKKQNYKIHHIKQIF